MVERIRQIWAESTWLLIEVIGVDSEIEQTLARLQAALDDLDAVTDPSDDQVAVVFEVLAVLQSKLLGTLVRLPKQHQPLLENLTDRIDIFLFHHRI
ncbi:MAG: hypothetical protein H7Z72_10110 [Bacteroidetes bacterium]|nr:hypothetical protein [Fibrella sp.]